MNCEAINWLQIKAAGKLPIHKYLTIFQSTCLFLWCVNDAAILVIIANHKSVAMAVFGEIPNIKRRIGVITAPPPMPVKPTKTPVKKPAIGRYWVTIG